MSEHNEIVIVRRRRGDHDGHHGGAWKIAFADFMTAMMAFFLVLWIVNSTSKETRSSVARYFNPIKISDTTPARKGLQDPKEEDFEASEDSKHKPKQTSKQEQSSDAKPAIGAPNKGVAPKSSPSAAAGENQPAAGQDRNDELRSATGGKAPHAKVEKMEDPFKLLRPKIVQQSYTDQSTGAARTQDKPVATERGQLPAPSEVAKPLPEQAKLSSDQQKATNSDTQLQKTVETLAKQENTRSGAKLISVTQVPEGTLISLLDASKVAMFPNGSFALSKDAAATLARIGKAISTVPNPVIVAGYTDSRAFKKGTGDNFKLSVLRAEAAMSILIRSGLLELRVERIEGHADRQPVTTGDGLNAVNRRIDILLRRTDG